VEQGSSAAWSSFLLFAAAAAGISRERFPPCILQPISLCEPGMGAGLDPQIRNIFKQYQRLRIGERLGVLNRASVNHVAHGKLRDLA
jgi:hypothetical protein